MKRTPQYLFEKYGKEVLVIGIIRTMKKRMKTSSMRMAS